MNVERLRADVVVAGAGPAGIAAAVAARATGASVHVIDANPQAGGAYWMQGTFAAAHTAQAEAGRTAIAVARAAGVVFHLGADIWGIFPGLRICAATADAALEITAASLVIASGAADRVPAFPGWTLPGVMTAGGAQRLAKLGGVPAGKRVVVAGSGAFLLVAAGAIGRAGATLAGYVEAHRHSLELPLHVARHPERWGEAIGLVRGISGRHTRQRFGWIVIEALGTERVEAVRIARLDRRGHIDRARTETIADIDALVTGWGFRPSIELTSLLRCAHAYDEAAGGWYCVADPFTGATSVPHVFAAGEVTGVAGALPAQLAGRFAGAAAAADAGYTAVPRRDAQTAYRALQRARAFAATLNRAFVPPPAIDELANDSTIVCRCEEVTKAAVQSAIGDGARSVLGAKLWTRAGMGRCQGRMCGWDIARLASPGDPAAAGYNHPRIPIRPVPLSAVAATLDDAVASLDEPAVAHE